MEAATDKIETIDELKVEEVAPTANAAAFQEQFKQQADRAAAEKAAAEAETQAKAEAIKEPEKPADKKITVSPMGIIDTLENGFQELLKFVFAYDIPEKQRKVIDNVNEQVIPLIPEWLSDPAVAETVVHGVPLLSAIFHSWRNKTGRFYAWLSKRMKGKVPEPSKVSTAAIDKLNEAVDSALQEVK